jgi:hypothetical protein
MDLGFRRFAVSSSSTWESCLADLNLRWLKDFSLSFYFMAVYICMCRVQQGAPEWNRPKYTSAQLSQDIAYHVNYVFLAGSRMCEPTRYTSSIKQCPLIFTDWHTNGKSSRHESAPCRQLNPSLALAFRDLGSRFHPRRRWESWVVRQHWYTGQRCFLGNNVSFTWYGAENMGQ